MNRIRWKRERERVNKSQPFCCLPSRKSISSSFSHIIDRLYCTVRREVELPRQGRTRRHPREREKERTKCHFDLIWYDSTLQYSGTYFQPIDRYSIGNLTAAAVCWRTRVSSLLLSFDTEEETTVEEMSYKPRGREESLSHCWYKREWEQNTSEALSNVYLNPSLWGRIVGVINKLVFRWNEGKRGLLLFSFFEHCWALPKQQERDRSRRMDFWNQSKTPSTICSIQKQKRQRPREL